MTIEKTLYTATTTLMQTIAAGALVLSMAAQATAAEPTQTGFNVGSPSLGGTREAIHQFRVEAEDGKAIESQYPSYRTTFELSSLALGGTREGVNVGRVKAEGNQTTVRQVAQSDQAAYDVGTLTQGTRG